MILESDATILGTKNLGPFLGQNFFKTSPPPTNCVAKKIPDFDSEPIFVRRTSAKIKLETV